MQGVISSLTGENINENDVYFKSCIDFMYNQWTVSSLRAGDTFHSLIVWSLLNAVSDMQQALLNHRKKRRGEGRKEEVREGGRKEERKGGRGGGRQLIKRSERILYLFPEKQNQQRHTYKYTYIKRFILFVQAIEKAGNFKIHRAGWQTGSSGSI